MSRAGLAAAILAMALTLPAAAQARPALRGTHIHLHPAGYKKLASLYFNKVKRALRAFGEAK